jgi:hypothetical protein
MALEQVDASGGEFDVTLPPGGGRVFMLGSEEEFAQCRDTVLRHRVRPPRVKARNRLRIAKAQNVPTGKADSLMEKAKKAEEAGNWKEAASTYEQVIPAIVEAEDEIPRHRMPLGYKQRVPDVKSMREKLDRAAEVLAGTDDLLRTHIRVLELERHGSHIYRFFDHPYVGTEIREWIALTHQYFNLLARYRTGDFFNKYQFPFYTLEQHIQVLIDQAESNKQAVEQAIDERLAEMRKPLKVALVTPNRENVQYNTLYSWFFENTHITWFAPDEAGALTGRNGEAFAPGDYDVVWVHQLRYPDPSGRPGSARDALMKPLLEEAALEQMRGYLADGGGLFLTGLAGAYVRVLELEDDDPAWLRQDSIMERDFTVKLKPAEGFAGHPALSSLPEGGEWLNANYPGRNLITECAWKIEDCDGDAIALQEGGEGVRPQGYVPAVEYADGPGKVIVFGGLSTDISPAGHKDVPGELSRQELRGRMRALELDVLSYLASDSRF